MSLYKTIFLADDDIEDREIFMEAIKMVDESVRFLSATNGATALQALQGDIIEKPDLIFLDMNMPFLNGKQLLAELKKIDELRNIPVVRYSTFFSQSDIEEMNKLGVAHYLLKPSKFNELIQSLREVLSK